MTVTVCFFTPQGVGPTKDAPGVGYIRAREAITIPGSTTNTVQSGEAVIVFNGETSGVLAAHGTTPDATAATATATTTAGLPVGAGQSSAPIMAATGSKINIKAIP